MSKLFITSQVPRNAIWSVTLSEMMVNVRRIPSFIATLMHGVEGREKNNIRTRYLSALVSSSVACPVHNYFTEDEIGNI